MKKFLFLGIGMLLALASSSWADDLGHADRRSSLTVVIDDNYPPLIFRDENGQLRGLRKDMWDLWSLKTGIPVILKAMDWNLALEAMKAGRADVVDTVFMTEPRRQLYDFSAPYNSIDVSIFFNRDLSGIDGVETLRGFTIGVKAGDACVTWLRDHGVGEVRPYSNYEALTNAAIRREIQLFCLDQPPAKYFLIRSNHVDDFRYTKPLYTGQMHWAVRKGDVVTFAEVSQGFDKISYAEQRDLERRWYGRQILGGLDWREYGRWLLLGAVALVALIVWNWMLRRQVSIRTRTLAAANVKLEYLAHHDLLTGLPNRLHLQEILRDIISLADQSGQMIAVILIDLDRFKAVVDSLGHAVGDAVLKIVADRLTSCFAAPSVISRDGGDEFLVLIRTESVKDKVMDMIGAFHRKMANPIKIGENEFVITLSSGIAVYPADGGDFDTLLKKADMAMYHAKGAGRNTSRFFSEDLAKKAATHMEVSGGLRNALLNDEFELYFQPQFHIGTGAMVGAEALIRWHHPERGLVSPGEFIPIAEDSGLILPIGEWVLREACKIAADWHRDGYSLPVAVNLSPLQFRRGELARQVQSALEESGLPPDLLELELTESILIQHTEDALETVRQIKSLNVHLSIDDFGTGYSSLAYIKRLAVDKLKVDQSFVRDLNVDHENAAITKVIIQMARSLNLTTLAEGVETKEVLDYLHRQQCDYAQGYYFARPMPVRDMIANFRTDRTKSDLGVAVAPGTLLL